ncbi:hypothetical protein BHYA_0227g00020 [Botrytis hyacinthi]|uniref:Uncharacterized protein n=1 Tax=Botrytis hyacinthi TaxID=278943 RepID=A0A4Z1GA06_9HELO|nr:hypothetical protein BHYA_0227g00020 [Botrytis hyacinthi]
MAFPVGIRLLTRSRSLRNPKVSPNIRFAADSSLTLSNLKSEIKTTVPTCTANFNGCFTVGNDSVVPKTIVAAVAAETSAASRVPVSI